MPIWGFMARPREFDRDEALGNAIWIFADHGFEATSTETLLQGMGISRQSLYDSFGDKRGLYLEALRRYSSESTAEIIGAMHSHASARKGLEDALLSFAARPPGKPCLGISAAAEFGRSNREVCFVTDAAAETMLAAFERVVRKGQQSGELTADVDPRTAAQFLSSTLAGLKISARAGTTRETLLGIARTALRSLT
jgi:AcrR family transcriptional regulator